MSAAKYPRIGRTRHVRVKEGLKRCPCGEVATRMVDIQVNPFRGDDEVEPRCEEHKACAALAPAGKEGA